MAVEVNVADVAVAVAPDPAAIVDRAADRVGGEVDAVGTVESDRTGRGSRDPVGLPPAALPATVALSESLCRPAPMVALLGALEVEVDAAVTSKHSLVAVSVLES